MSKPDEQSFLAGVCWVLSCFEHAGEAQSTLYVEIVRAAGEDDLIAHARRHGQMRISGLNKYVRNLKEGCGC